MELTQQDLVLAGLSGIPTDSVDRNVKEFVDRLLAREGTTLWRRQFIERIPMLDKETIQGLISGKLQIVDVFYYSRATFSGTSCDLFPKDSKLVVGKSNIESAELPKDQPMVLSAISLQYSATDVDNFDPAQFPADLVRGEFSFRYEKTDVLPSMPVLGTFSPSVANYDTDKPYGRYDLKNPKVIIGGKKLEGEVEIPAAFSAGTHSLAIILHGTGVSKA